MLKIFQENRTTLHQAAKRGDIKTAEALISSGANVNALGEVSEYQLH